LFIALILAATFGLLRAREREEVLPPRSNLSNFPYALHQWYGRDLQTTEEMTKSLGPGEFLFRDYVDADTRSAAGLLIAYFPSQRTGDTIHSPKNCLPGSGWVPAGSTRIWIPQGSGSKVELNQVLVQKGDERALVLYWYQAHGRVTPSEYAAKYHLVADAIRMNRSDGALVRVTTFLGKEDSVADAQARAVAFAQMVLPLLDTYIPR